MPLIQICDMMREPNQREYRTSVLSFAKTMEQKVKQMYSETLEAKLLEAYFGFRQSRPPCAEVASAVEAEQDYELRRLLNPRKVSEVMRVMGFEAARSRY